MEPDAAGEPRKVELRWPLPDGGWAGCEFNLYVPAAPTEESDDTLSQAQADLAAQMMDALDLPRVLVYEGGELSVEVTEDEEEHDEEDES